MKHLRWIVVVCVVAIVASGCSRSDDDRGSRHVVDVVQHRGGGCDRRELRDAQGRLRPR